MKNKPFGSLAAQRVGRLRLVTGDVIWRWWDHAFGAVIQPLQVLLVNRKSVTVLTERGVIFKATVEEVEGRYAEGDARFPNDA